MKRNILCTIIIFIFTSAINFAQDTVIRVACVGNSITEGFGTSDSRSYPQQLGLRLGSHYNVRNFGFGGRTLLKKGDFPYWVEDRYFNAKDFVPQILIIKLGTNDSKPQNWIYKDEFFSDYCDMVNECRAVNPHMQVYVCLPCPVHIDGYGITGSIVTNEIIPLIDSVKKTLNTCEMDFYTPFVNKANLFSDGIHPNQEGYSMMGQIAYETIMNSPSGFIRYFTPKKSTFELGESVTLYWETTQGSQVTINGVQVNSTDSMMVNPAGSTTYTLITSGEYPDTMSITPEYIKPGTIKSFNVTPEFLEIGKGDSSIIRWLASKGSAVTFDGIPVEREDSITVRPNVTTMYTIIASGINTDTVYVKVEVVEADKLNRVYKQTPKASSTARGSAPANAFDGKTETEWVSESAKTQWVSVDVGKDFVINRIVIKWGNNYATSYRVEVLDEDNHQAVLYANTASDGDTDDVDGFTTKAHYIRILCLNKTDASAGYTIKEFEVYGKSISTGINEKILIPRQVKLNPNFPNPFNPVTRISYEIPETGNVELKIFDILGKEVRTLVNKVQDAGIYEIEFDASRYTSGIYICKLNFGNNTQIRKMMLTK